MQKKKRTNPNARTVSPEEIGQAKHDAAKLIQEFYKLQEELAQTQRALIATCAKYIAAPPDKDPNRLIWQGILRYANSNLHNDKGLVEAIPAFIATTVLCINRYEDISETRNPFETLPFGDLKTDLTTAKNVLLQKRICALQAPFRRMLTWLTDPSCCSVPLTNEAFDFLLEHGGDGAVEFGFDVNHEFNHAGDAGGSPIFYWKTPLGYKTILSPIASFILERINQYQFSTRGERLTIDEAVPLIICKRPTCLRFVIPRRKTKDFCSSSCRTLYHQKIKAEDHAAYQRKYREIYKKPKARTNY
ncbi:MAG TPA: hypothetical protein VI636_09730 [Candidatus Angelobacter sp.]